MNLQSAKPGVLAIATVAERNPAVHVNDYSDYVKISLNIKLKAILYIHGSFAQTPLRFKYFLGFLVYITFVSRTYCLKEV